MIDFLNARSIVTPKGEIALITRGTEILWRKQKYKRELAYLESTGTQWLDLMFAPNNNASVILDAQITSGEGYLYGVYEPGTAYIYMRLNNGAFRIRYGSRVQRTLLNTGEYERHVFSHKKNVCAIDDTEYAYDAQVFSFSTTLVLFGYRNGETVDELVKARAYSVRAYDNDILARDCVPVLDWDDVPCMYDKVTDELFYNQGTGEFLYGQEGDS